MSMFNLIKDFFEGISSQISIIDTKINKVSYNFERQIKRNIRKIKKEITTFFLFLIFMFLTIIFLLMGIIFFLNNFLDIEVILLGFGVIFAFITILVKIL